MDYFSLLGLPRRLDFDETYLRERYYQRCAEQHPDRYTHSDAPAPVAATLHSARINQAYRILRDPVTRARHFLDLHGISLGAQGSAVPKAIADRCLATQELLLRFDAGESGAFDFLAAERSRLVTLRRKLVASLEEQFLLWNVPSADDSGSLGQIQMVLLELHYLDKLLRNLSQRLDHLGEV